MIEVYFLPFDSDPQKAVTTETIQTLGDYTQVPLFSFAMNDLRVWVSHARRSGTFDDQAVRARVVFPDGTEVVLDASGTIKRGSASFRNDAKIIDDLAQVFEWILEEAAEEEKLRRQWPWVISAANVRIAENEGWAKSDYGLWLASPWCNDFPQMVCVMVLHREDIEPYIFDTPVTEGVLGGGKSFLMTFDPASQNFVEKWLFQ